MICLMPSSLTPVSFPFEMNITIKIHPVPIAGTSRKEQFARAQVITSELRNLEGVETAECYELKSPGIQNTLDPLITVIITAAGPVVSTLISEIFALLRDKRDKKDHRATVFIVGDDILHIENKNETSNMRRLTKIIKKHSTKKK